MKRISPRVLLGLSSLFATACSPAITYPPEQGVMTSSTAATEPVPTLMAEAIEFAYDRWGDGGEFAINLPPGTAPEVYDKVIQRLGGGRPMQDPDEPAYHVTRVSSQGFEATVDLFYPKPDGAHQFVTMTFHREMVGGWQHQHTRAWQTGDQPPPPAYAEALAGTSPEP
jgi:hypothetical protein